MDGISCDRCGKSLLVDERVRYIVDARVYAAYDPLEVAREDLECDHRAAMQRLLEEIAARDPGTLEDEVARVFRFDLCPPCQKEFLQSTRAFFRSTPSS